MLITSISLKIYFPDSIIRISVDENKKLRDIIQKYIKIPCKLFFLDEENEWITIENEKDWKTAIDVYKNNLKVKTLKLKVEKRSTVMTSSVEEILITHLDVEVPQILRLSGLQMVNLLKLKRVTSLKLIEEHISHIKQVNPKLNAMVNERFEDAIKEAKKVDEIISNTSNLDELYKKHPYFGVPCSIKENIQVKDMKNSSGLVSRINEISKEDADVVKLMKQAGFIILGNTNVSEICMWIEANNEVYGRTNNPYDLERTAGGSSGGEGCTVGSGCTPIGIGSDIGGSIRIPAYFNGVFGHKATGLAISNKGQFPGTYGEADKYLCTGPICKKSEDLWPLLKILSEGRIRGDPSNVDLKKIKVISIEEIDIFLMHFTRDVVNIQKKVVTELTNLGCEIRRDVKKIEHMEEAVDIWAALLEIDSRGGPGHWENLGKPNVFVELYKLLNQQQSDFTLPCIILCYIEYIQKLMPERLEKYYKLGEEMREKLINMLGNDTVLVFPSYMTPVPKHNQPKIYPISWVLQGIFNMMTTPVTQVPLGLNENGLPLGIQIVSAPGNDVLTVAVAIALEKKFGGWSLESKVLDIPKLKKLVKLLPNQSEKKSLFTRLLDEHKLRINMMKKKSLLDNNDDITVGADETLLSLVETFFFDEWIPSVFTTQSKTVNNQFSKETSLFLHELTMKILHIKFYNATKLKKKEIINFLTQEQKLKIRKYNELRLLFGLKTLKHFTELTKNQKILSTLTSIYKTIDNLDTSIGIHLESFDNKKDTLTRVLLLLPYKRFTKPQSLSDVKKFKSKLFDYQSIKQHSTNPFDETDGEYQRSHLFHSRYKLYWRYNSTHVDFEIQGITTGWVGIGFKEVGNTTHHLGVDLVIGRLQNGKYEVGDYYGNTSYGVPILDIALGGQHSNIGESVTFIESLGVTKVQFTRSRVSSDLFDTNFTRSTFSVHFAFSENYNLTTHSNAGKTDLILFTDFLTPGYPEWLTYTVIGIASGFIIICIFFMIFVLACYTKQPIRKATPWALLLILFGSILLMISVILTTLINYNNLTICLCRGYSFSYGFVFVVGSLFAKNQKYYRYYGRKNAVTTENESNFKSNSYIARYLIVFLVAQTILLLLWALVHPPQIFDLAYGETTKFILCDDDPVVMGVLIGYKCLILIWALIISIYSRTISSLFYEVHFLSFSTFSMALIFLVTVPIMFIVTDIIALSIIFYIANFLALIIILSLMFVPKAYFVFQSLSVKVGNQIANVLRKKEVKSPKEIELQEEVF
eukprot:gene3408-5953_t